MKSHLKFVIRHAHTTHREAVLQAFDPKLEEKRNGESQGVKIYIYKSNQHTRHVCKGNSTYIQNHTVIFRQFISQKLVNLNIIWVVGPFGIL